MAIRGELAFPLNGFPPRLGYLRLKTQPLVGFAFLDTY